MAGPLLLLRSLLTSPSAQPDDPAAWVGNQAAHALVVGGALLALVGWLPQAVWIVAGLYALWELAQLRYGSTPWDGLCDWAFTVTGALLVEAGWHGDAARFRPLLAGLLLAAAAGIWRRLR